VASGIRVPAAIGDFLILRAIKASNGFAIAVPDEAIERARAEAASKDGLLLCPEGAATLAGYQAALKDGRVSTDDEVVLYNCGSGLKYPMPEGGVDLDRNIAIDYEAMKS
jgi:threonine synthase